MEQIRSADKSRFEVSAFGNKLVELLCSFGNVIAYSELNRKHPGSLGCEFGRDSAVFHEFTAEGGN